ncbi:MAG: GNAT family N-acetyltransferase [Candidatus Saccharibacteria bacterium]
MQKKTASHQTIQITPMRLRDVKETRRVFVDAVENHFDYFDADYRAQVLRDNSLPRLAFAGLRAGRIVLVAKHRDRIVGYCIGSIPKDGHAQIYWLFVDPTLRGSNIGLRLLSRILKMMEQAGSSEATLITHNYATYYARQGFKQLETVKRGKIEEYILSYPLGERKR